MDLGILADQSVKSPMPSTEAIDAAISLSQTYLSSTAYYCQIGYPLHTGCLSPFFTNYVIFNTWIWGAFFVLTCLFLLFFLPQVVHHFYSFLVKKVRGCLRCCRNRPREQQTYDHTNSFRSPLLGSQSDHDTGTISPIESPMRITRKSNGDISFSNSFSKVIRTKFIHFYAGILFTFALICFLRFCNNLWGYNYRHQVNESNGNGNEADLNFVHGVSTVIGSIAGQGITHLSLNLNVDSSQHLTDVTVSSTYIPPVILAMVSSLLIAVIFSTISRQWARIQCQLLHKPIGFPYSLGLPGQSSVVQGLLEAQTQTSTSASPSRSNPSQHKPTQQEADVSFNPASSTLDFSIYSGSTLYDFSHCQKYYFGNAFHDVCFDSPSSSSGASTLSSSSAAQSFSTLPTQPLQNTSFGDGDSSQWGLSIPLSSVERPLPLNGMMTFSSLVDSFQIPVNAKEFSLENKIQFLRFLELETREVDSTVLRQTNSRLSIGSGHTIPSFHRTKGSNEEIFEKTSTFLDTIVTSLFNRRLSWLLFISNSFGLASSSGCSPVNTVTMPLKEDLSIPLSLRILHPFSKHCADCCSVSIACRRLHIISVMSMVCAFVGPVTLLCTYIYDLSFAQNSSETPHLFDIPPVGFYIGQFFFVLSLVCSLWIIISTFPRFQKYVKASYIAAETTDGDGEAENVGEGEENPTQAFFSSPPALFSTAIGGAVTRGRSIYRHGQTNTRNIGSSNPSNAQQLFTSYFHPLYLLGNYSTRVRRSIFVISVTLFLLLFSLLLCHLATIFYPDDSTLLSNLSSFTNTLWFSFSTPIPSIPTISIPRPNFNLSSYYLLAAIGEFLDILAVACGLIATYFVPHRLALLHLKRSLGNNLSTATLASLRCFEQDGYDANGLNSAEDTDAVVVSNSSSRLSKRLQTQNEALLELQSITDFEDESEADFLRTLGSNKTKDQTHVIASPSLPLPTSSSSSTASTTPTKSTSYAALQLDWEWDTIRLPRSIAPPSHTVTSHDAPHVIIENEYTNLQHRLVNDLFDLCLPLLNKTMQNFAKIQLEILHTEQAAALLYVNSPSLQPNSKLLLAKEMRHAFDNLGLEMKKIIKSQWTRLQLFDHLSSATNSKDQDIRRGICFRALNMFSSSPTRARTSSQSFGSHHRHTRSISGSSPSYFSENPSHIRKISSLSSPDSVSASASASASSHAPIPFNSTSTSISTSDLAFEEGYEEGYEENYGVSDPQKMYSAYLSPSSLVSINSHPSSFVSDSEIEMKYIPSSSSGRGYGDLPSSAGQGYGDLDQYLGGFGFDDFENDSNMSDVMSQTSQSSNGVPSIHLVQTNYHTENHQQSSKTPSSSQIVNDKLRHSLSKRPGIDTFETEEAIYQSRLAKRFDVDLDMSDEVEPLDDQHDHYEYDSYDQGPDSYQDRPILRPSTAPNHASASIFGLSSTKSDHHPAGFDTEFDGRFNNEPHSQHQHQNFPPLRPKPSEGFDQSF